MAIKGAILGDILGSQYEFSRPADLDWKNVPLAGNYIDWTDDTVMTLAIKKAVKNGLDMAQTMYDIGKNYMDCGYGGRFYDWLVRGDLKPYGSYGNGSAMRVSYIADHYNDLEKVQEVAAQSAKVTHNHREGIKGAVVTATCIWMAKNGKTKQDIYDYVLEEYPEDKYKYSINHDMEWLRKNYEWDVTCQGSVAPAMRCFYESEDWESFMRNIFSFYCDSDTLGAIGGGVAEEFYHGFGDRIKVDKVLEIVLEKELYDLLME